MDFFEKFCENVCAIGNGLFNSTHTKKIWYLQIPDLQATLKVTIGLLLCVFVFTYKRGWYVLAKCSFCDSVGKVCRRKFDCWRCDNCRRMNNFSKAKSSSSSTSHEELLRGKKATLTSAIDENKSPCLPMRTTNNSIDEYKGAGEKCSSIFKAMIKDNLKMKFELVSTQKRLYDMVKEVKSLKKSLFNATEMADAARPRPSETLPKSPNVKRRSSFFSSTHARPIQESDKQKVLKNLGAKVMNLQMQMRMVRDAHEMEVNIFEDKVVIYSNIIKQLDQLNQEIVKVYDETRD